MTFGRDTSPTTASRYLIFLILLLPVAGHGPSEGAIPARRGAGQTVPLDSPRMNCQGGQPGVIAGNTP